ncbi:MAG: DNA polymerase I [Thermaerobacter sp.]|nr:DNA polymerase I [Thermaerobacter sp.]
MRTVLLVDGMNLLFRAYHALANTKMSTPEGTPTFAVYGFATMLLKAAQDTEPDVLVVAWDSPGGTFRHEQYQEYKAGREAAPDDFHVQVPLAFRLLEVLQVHQVAAPGFEADDIIGTLAGQIDPDAEDCRVLILSGDRDLLQLVRPGVTVLYPGRDAGSLAWLDEAGVKGKLSVRPNQVTDLKGLMGDSSDNIKGVPGIGEKSAVLLLARYEHLEDVFRAAAAGEIPESRIRKALMGQDRAGYDSRALATVRQDLPLTLPPPAAEPYRVRPTQELAAFLDDMRFNTLKRRLLGAEPEPAPAADPDPTGTVEDFTRPVDWPEGPVVALAADPSRPVGDAWHVAWEGGAGTVAGGFTPGEGQQLVGFGIKEWVLALPPAVRPRVADAEVAAYLLDPTLAAYTPAVLGTLLGRPMAGLSGLAAAVPSLLASLDASGLRSLYEDVEMPLVSVLAAMEARGLAADRTALENLGVELDAGLRQLAQDIYVEAGVTFNLNSSRQLGEVLFDHMGLPKGRKTKTGYSTDADTLEALAPHHPVVAKILSWRQLEKLRGTYVEALLPLIAPDGRIHTHLNQTVAATGRLSSSDPNLQNIPIRSAWGQRVRSVFGPSAGRVLLAADYSQIELRMLAHFAQDPVLLEAFWTGEDIHRRTAAEMFGVEPSQVTAELRGRAKAINFGIIYGISDFGLANQTGVPRAAAAEYIQRYYERYPRIRAFFDQVLAEAKRDGRVSTLLGRRRPMPDIAARHPVQRHYAERTAVNTVIQGSAADLIKVAMVRVEEALGDRGFTSAMVLQVHDELIWDAVPEEVPALVELAGNVMTEALPLTVPLVVDFKQGADWGHLVPVASREGTGHRAGTA